MANNINGPSLAEKQILLLKLTELMDNRPAFGTSYISEPDAIQWQWLARAKGIMQRCELITRENFYAAAATVSSYWVSGFDSVQREIYETIEGFKIDLEIEGRDQIGFTYKTGDTYTFFSDLKGIIKCAQSEIFLIDPYFDGQSFDDYLSNTSSNLRVRILAKNYVSGIEAFAKRHVAQFKSNISLRSSKSLHDRVLFLDNSDCWIMGGSIKDGGQKPTYLIPLAPALAPEKLAVYEGIWSLATDHPL